MVGRTARPSARAGDVTRPMTPSGAGTTGAPHASRGALFSLGQGLWANHWHAQAMKVATLRLPDLDRCLRTGDHLVGLDASFASASVASCSNASAISSIVFRATGSCNWAAVRRDSSARCRHCVGSSIEGAIDGQQPAPTRVPRYEQCVLECPPLSFSHPCVLPPARQEVCSPVR